MIQNQIEKFLTGNEMAAEAARAQARAARSFLSDRYVSYLSGELMFHTRHRSVSADMY